MKGPSTPPPEGAAHIARRTLSLPEFVALVAMLAATIAFSIDAMLPALPEIGEALSPANPNAAQLVVVAFVLGMGVGTIFAGPLSDALGRKPVMLGGAALYCVSAIVCVWAPSLEMLLLARVAQGLGAAGPRVVAMAMIRDLYMGRGMARVSSFVMMTFTLVPAIAPLVGAWIIGAFGWRAIFWSFVVFSSISGAWLWIRQPETLSAEYRRPLNLSKLGAAAAEVLTHPNVRRAIWVQTLIFAILFATIISVQPTYEITFDRAESFPLWFGVVALISGLASLMNATLVERLGMLWLLRRGLVAHLLLSVVFAAVWLSGLLDAGGRFALFVVWQVGSFALAGLTIGNLNAIAMQPMGHIAGMASSVISALATVLAVAIAVPIGQAFDGTPLPLTVGVALCAALALWLARTLGEDAA